MEPLYGKIDIVLKELRTVGLPRRTLDVMEDYFSCNEDPIYKLSVLASSIMMAYIKEDEINNIKE